jgi:hypothetical protein
MNTKQGRNNYNPVTPITDSSMKHTTPLVALQKCTSLYVVTHKLKRPNLSTFQRDYAQLCARHGIQSHPYFHILLYAISYA